MQQALLKLNNKPYLQSQLTIINIRILTMRKLSIITATLITSSIWLTGCGDGSDTANEVDSSPVEITPPTSNIPNDTTPPVSNSVSLLGLKGKSQIQVQKVKGIAKPQNAIVDAEFSNAKGDFIYKDNASSVTGNLTFAINVEEPDQITDISLYLPSVEQSISVCSSACGATFNKTLTGFNPQLSGVKAGNLRIELFVTDSAQNTAMLDAISVDWSPIVISGFNATRTEGKIIVDWQGGSSLNRYNVYSATEVNLTSTNALSLTNGSQQLALNASQAEIAVTDETANYYILITGINEQGESGQSSPLRVAPILAAVNLPPQAVTDSFTVDEDNALNANVLDNDTDPENSLLTLDSIISSPVNGQLTFDSSGNISYQPNKDFAGQDSFIYQILDDANNSAQASVSITVNNLNDAPIATNDAYSLAVDNTINITNTGLLANDLDIDGDFLFVNTTPITAPLHGSLQLHSDGSFTYTADSSFIDSDSFEYQITDNKGGTDNAQVTILPSGTDAPPIALNDIYEVNEDNTLAITSITNGILANDTDPNSLALSLNETLITTTTNGQLNLSIDGTFTYIPNANFFGIDSFQYEIMNVLGKKSQAFVNITVNPIADNPVANNDTYQTNEDSTLTVNAVNGLLANDLDIDLGTLIVETSPLVSPTLGQLTLQNDGGFTYKANANINGVDTFTYRLLNNKGAVNSAQVIITLTPVNDAPIAINDSKSTISDTLLTIDALENDTDADGDPLTIIRSSTATKNGTVSILENKLIYTPLITFTGVASINYTIADSSGLESSATVSVLVSLAGSTNILPIAVNDTFILDEDTVFSGASVLNNDSDANGDTLSVLTTAASPTTNGTLVLSTDGTFVYTPATNFNGSDSFRYTLSDGNGGFAEAQVNLTIKSINDLPVANADSYSTLEDIPFTIIASDFNNLLNNDTDVDGDTLSVNVALSGNVSSGVLSLDNDGEFTYTPETNFSGTDSFIYHLEDGQGGSSTGSVTITVNHVNKAPKALPDTYTMIEGTSLDATSVLSNDTDPDGDPLTLDTSFSSLPSHGTVSFSSDGTFTYTPETGFFGADSFAYKVLDSSGEFDEGLVNITVKPDSSAHGNPLARNDSYSVDEDTTLVASSVLNNDKSDVLDILNLLGISLLTISTSPADDVDHGTLSINSDGTFTYTPDTNYNGNDSFKYEITNIYGNTDTATVQLTIKAVNDAPIAVDDSFTVEKNSGKFTKKFLLDNDSDPEGDHLDINETPIIDAHHGTLKIKKHGDVEYTPDTDFVGTDSFVYELGDGKGLTDLATVTITITDN